MSHEALGIYQKSSIIFLILGNGHTTSPGVGRAVGVRLHTFCVKGGACNAGMAVLLLEQKSTGLLVHHVVLHDRLPSILPSSPIVPTLLMRPSQQPLTPTPWPAPRPIRISASDKAATICHLADPFATASQFQ